MRLNIITIARYTLLCLMMIAPNNAQADSLKSLLMPGKVISAHEKYEQQCDKCHDAGDKNRQAKLCMSCHDHKNIRGEVRAGTGFHGRLPSSQQNECKHCHSEHKGRDAKVVLLNKATFDHNRTDFKLKGEHRKTSCNSCHKPEKKYSEAPTKCYDCHKDDDVHDGKQGKKCESCHAPASWKKTAFDHDETDFPLKGRHKDTICSACHINQKYKDTPKQCYSCHQINDAHRGELGKKCDSCHTPKAWDKVSFDHNKKTDFKLYGKHTKAACTSCHKPGSMKNGKVKKEMPKKCYGCHKNDDTHKGQYGKKCNDCHSTWGWKKQKFDHTKKTDFPLLGRHNKLSCNQCHKGDLYEDELSMKCYDCHKKDDAHKGKQGKDCGSCHNEKGWHDNVFFDHDLSKFPLIGMHAATQCEECHLTTEYSNVETGCNHCHADDDDHRTRLGTDCESCHNPNSWNTWLFDHDERTRFVIDGAHQDLGCLDCHKTNSDGPLEATGDCIFCHRAQDVHNRQFGRHCDDCHSTTSFSEVIIRR